MALVVPFARRRLLAMVSLLTCAGSAKSWATDPRSLPPVYSIAADDDGLYGISLTEFGAPGSVWRLAYGQSEPEVLAQADLPRSLMPHGPDLYFTSDGWVMRVPKIGGTSERVAKHAYGYLNTQRDDVFDMVCDETDLYVSVQDTRRPTAGGTPKQRPGALLRMRLPRGPLVQIAEHDYSHPRLAVDEARVYVTTEDGIAAVDKGGGTLQALVAAGDVNDRPTKLANGGRFLYAPGQGQLKEIDKRTGEVAVLYRASILLDVAVHQGWVYVVRNTSFQGVGKPPEPGGLLAVSQADHTVRTIAEPLNLPQLLAIGGQTVFVLELAGNEAGLVQVKRFAALAQT